MDFSGSGISDKKDRNPRIDFLLQSVNAEWKSTNFHAVSNMQQDWAGIPENGETVVKAQKLGQNQQVVTQTVLEGRQNDTDNETTSTNCWWPTHAWKPFIPRDMRQEMVEVMHVGLGKLFCISNKIK